MGFLFVFKLIYNGVQFLKRPVRVVFCYIAGSVTGDFFYRYRII